MAGSDNNANGIRVMIADENARVRDALAARLSRYPGVVVVATTGDFNQARRLFQSHSPHVLVVETKTRDPRPDWRLLNFVSLAMQGQCQVLVLTSYTDELERDHAAHHGVEHYLLKDIDSRSLLAAIQSAAARAHARPNTNGQLPANPHTRMMTSGTGAAQPNESS